jgi:hypothetical protein
MRTRTLALATFVILICSFVFSASLVRADPYDEWYQGRQGHWVQEQNAWRFQDRNGSEYRQYGDNWRWAEPAPMARAEATEWYQGRRGHWIQERNEWLFRDLDGNVYRRSSEGWRWVGPAMAAGDADDVWYQGRRGHWVQAQNGWRFRDSDGNVYRQHGNSWRWYNGRAHGAEGSEYHNRAPGDNRTYEQFQQQEGR